MQRAVRRGRARRRRADVARGAIAGLVDGAVDVIADAARWGGDATDAARKLALEAISNAYAADDGDAHAAWLRARVVALLPPRTSSRRPTTGSRLAATRPRSPRAAAAAAPRRRPPPRPPTPTRRRRRTWRRSWRKGYLQCVGAALVAADSEDEAAAAASTVRAAATADGARAPSLRAHPRRLRGRDARGAAPADERRRQPRPPS